MGNTFSCSTAQSSDNLKSSMSDLPKSLSGKAGYQVPPPPPPRPRHSGRNVKEEAPPLPAKVPLTARTNDVSKGEMTSSSPQQKTDATGQGPVSSTSQVVLSRQSTMKGRGLIGGDHLPQRQGHG